MSLKDDFYEDVAQQLRPLPHEPTPHDVVRAIAAALERLAPRFGAHNHFHVADGQILNAVGDLVRIEPVCNSPTGVDADGN